MSVQIVAELIKSKIAQQIYKAHKQLFKTKLANGDGHLKYIKLTIQSSDRGCKMVLDVFSLDFTWYRHPQTAFVEF